MKALSLRRLPLAFTTGALILLWAVNSCKISTDGETSNSEIILSSKLPTHNIDYTQSQDDIQVQFNSEMWQTFVALCSPADGLTPISKGRITDQKDARAVFQNYSFNYDLFLLNLPLNKGIKPVGWGQFNSLDRQRRERWNSTPYCPDLVAQAEAKGITNMASLLPLDEFIQASNDPRPHVPIVDQNQNYVRTGVVYNQITFDWVIANQLETDTGVVIAENQLTRQEVRQVKDGEVTTFSQMLNQLKTPIGAIQLKTSWKILGDGDDPSKFHTEWAAALFENLNYMDSLKVIPQCSLVQVGLVGMHISKKTDTQPDYIWATFEHIDNCPEGIGQDKHYSFYDFALGDSMRNQPPLLGNENVNTDSSHYTFPEWFNPQGTPTTPSQVVRDIPIPTGTKRLNQSYQQALANTVWANYQLVGTQWTDPFDKKIIPELLSNTTLETFEQKRASCIGCHHQVLPNTYKGTINDYQFRIGNKMNLNLELKPSPDKAVYSDYMWSLLKMSKKGHLTWYQIRKK